MKATTRYMNRYKNLSKEDAYREIKDLVLIGLYDPAAFEYIGTYLVVGVLTYEEFCDAIDEAYLGTFKFIDRCPNKRILHLLKHSKKTRVRNKNYRRVLKALKGELFNVIDKRWIK